ncbi:hypothetical protein FOA52_007331 [Chlamydomonas sp. UWO 241]|nr:hypothetical protein FOA52_007331 [Chlamydomonas sp. UWO 241]
MMMRTASLSARRCSAPRLVRPSVPRSGPVRALAFSGPTDKKARLTSVAREFVDVWAQGSTNAKGPNKQALAEIAKIVTPNIRVNAVHPLGNVEFSGLSGVSKKMMLDATFKSSMRPSHVLLTAADEDTGCVFLLLECEEMGSMDEDVNIVLLELHCVGNTYGIIKLQVDPESLKEGSQAKISKVTERMQLGPADVCLLTMLYPDHKLAQSIKTEENLEKDHAGKVALRLASAWHFPRERINTTPLEGSALAAASKAMQAWCDAHSSGADVDGLLKSVTAPNFGLWDPYGVLPTVCGIQDDNGKCTYKGIQADTSANCVMPLDSVVNRLHVLQSDYGIRCHLIDSAVCASHNVGFAHWRMEMRQIIYTKDARVVDPEIYTIEAMAVHIFTPEGAIKDTWMLRDPYEAEKIKGTWMLRDTYKAEKDLMTSVCTIGGAVTKAATPFETCNPAAVDMAEC